MSFHNRVERLEANLDLVENEETWDKISHSITSLTAFCQDLEYDDHDQLVHLLKAHSISLTTSIKSERTRLSGAAIDLISVASTVLGTSFGPLLPYFLPTLLGICARANKVFVVRSRACITTVIETTQLPSILSYLVHDVHDKSTSVRFAVVEATLTCLNCLNPPDLEKEPRLREVEGLIRGSAKDASAEVRALSKKAFEAYKVLFPAKVDSFAEPLSPTIRKYLDILPRQPSKPKVNTNHSVPRPPKSGTAESGQPSHPAPAAKQEYRAPTKNQHDSNGASGAKGSKRPPPPPVAHARPTQSKKLPTDSAGAQPFARPTSRRTRTVSTHILPTRPILSSSATLPPAERKLGTSLSHSTSAVPYQTSVQPHPEIVAQRVPIAPGSMSTVLKPKTGPKPPELTENLPPKERAGITGGKAPIRAKPTVASSKRANKPEKKSILSRPQLTKAASSSSHVFQRPQRERAASSRLVMKKSQVELKATSGSASSSKAKGDAENESETGRCTTPGSAITSTHPTKDESEDEAVPVNLGEPHTPQASDAGNMELAFKTPISKLLFSIEAGFADLTPPSPPTSFQGFQRPNGLYTPFPLHMRKSIASEEDGGRLALDDIANIPS